MKQKRPGPPKGKKHSEIVRSAFGERLFKTRKTRGLTQTELGSRAGVSKRVIAFYEGNKPGPPPELLKKFAEALNVTTSYLLGESPLKEISDDVKPSLKKYIDKLKSLPPKEQKTILNMIEIASKTFQHNEE